jgi:hypothetical protein
MPEITVSEDKKRESSMAITMLKCQFYTTQILFKAVLFSVTYPQGNIFIFEAFAVLG